MRRTMIGLCLLTVGGCAKTLPPPEEPAPVTHFRPLWLASLPEQVDAMALCLEPLEAPRFVLFVDPLVTGASGVTTVNAYGAVENCVVDKGRIVRREPVASSASEFASLPFFSLGPTQPVVPTGVLVEEVLEHGAVIGFLHWPGTANSEAGGGL